MQETLESMAQKKSQFKSFDFYFTLQLWTSFLLPLSAKYQIENIFALPYIGVHAITLYSGLGIFAVASWPTYLLFVKGKATPDRARIVSILLATVGSLVKLLSYINYEKDGLLVPFIIG